MRLPALAAMLSVALGLLAATSHRPAAVHGSAARVAHPHRARGAVHVHTARSGDGHGNVASVAAAARRAGLHFVVITDHNADPDPALEGWRRGVLVLAGTEKSTNGGHALVLGLAALPFRLDGDPKAVVADAADLGGFVIAAHPASTHPESRWSGDLAGVAGIEVMNFAEPQAWPSGAGRLVSLARFTLDPQGTLLRSFRHDRAALELWRRELARRPVAALLGSDAHGGFPSHLQVFRLASQHLLLDSPLTGDLAADRRAVLEALRLGRGYLGVDSLADASGFVLEAGAGERRALMGEELSLGGGETAEIRAEADAPSGTVLALMRDGHEVARGTRISHSTGVPGAYRVEAYLAPRLVPGGRATPWIVSNAVYVFPEPELRARAERSRPAPEEPPPADVEVLESFDSGSLGEHWQIDRSPEAAAQTGLEDGALRFDFALGPGPRSHASVCDWRPRDLAGYRSLVFRVRADRMLRFDVQVRVADEGSPGGVRIWRRSVRADTRWRSASLRLAELRTYDGRGGAPALNRVRGIYFHVDEASLVPGSRGAIWIDDLAFSPS